MEKRLDHTFINHNAILLFDGYCNLCAGSVQFILQRDPKGYFSFLSLQDEKTDALFEVLQQPKPETDSVVLIEQGQVYTRSTAALRITQHLRRGWPLLQVFWIVPRVIRDKVYDWVARNRYAWFGRKESCWLPQPEWKERFL